MNEYWEITHTRGIATQAVWTDQPDFALNKLSKTQHSALVDAMPSLAQERANKESDLTGIIAGRHDTFELVTSLDVRVPGVLGGTLDDEDDLQEQFDHIYAIDPGASQESALRRARLVLPLWQKVDAARAALTPAEPPIKLKVVVNGASVSWGAADFEHLIDQAENVQKAEAAAQHEVTAAKAALRAADHKLDRANKRWYKAWMKAFPPGTPEGDAAKAQIPTELNTVADPEALEITLLTPQANHTILVAFNPDGGAHATTRELLYRLAGEPEFGHTAPITGTSMVAGPFAAGALVTFRTRVANSNPGTVPSAEKTAVAL